MKPVRFSWGTTSACAENTFTDMERRLAARNYLRVRGEYTMNTTEAWKKWELPPRARRIPPIWWGVLFMPRTTSACAENTPLEGAPYVWGGNYLRVRGEYPSPKTSTPEGVELPPRARRIPQNVKTITDAVGTTSACAENTLNELGLL